MYREIGSLGEYELDRMWQKIAPLTRQYQNNNACVLIENIIERMKKYSEKCSWFKSKNFLEFTKEYYNVKILVDGYISGNILLKSLLWLDKGIGRYKKRLSLIEKGKNSPIYIGDIFYSPNYPELNEKGNIDVKDYDFTLDYFVDKSPYTLYGLSIRRLMFQIYRGLFWMLQLKPEIRHCSYEDGVRNSYCNNIFIPNRKIQKFCSDKCRLDHHNRYKPEYMRKKRNPNSAEYDPKYVK